MCGIFGVWLKSPASQEHIQHLVVDSWAQMYNRGPDGKGAVIIGQSGAQWLSNEPIHINGTTSLILTHTRLAIQDLTSAGAQPMCDATGRYWITFNGEIYNFQQLRRDLELDGVRFKSHSDTEVLLELWARHSYACLHRLSGMFAFAIYDSHEKAVYLARDRIGIKPLYYSSSPECIVAFGSEQATLLATKVVSPQPNWDGIASGLMFQGALRPHTVYKHIFALPPGQFAKISSQGISLHEYWDLEEVSHGYTGADNKGREASIVFAHDFLKETIKKTLVSDVEIGTLLSGGIDSSTMSGIASQFHPNIAAYTLAWGSDVAANSELEQAKVIASNFPIRHHIELISPGGIAKDLPEMLSFFEEPIGLLEPHYPIAKCVSQDGIRVLLNGLGPDEMLGGYGYYRGIPHFKKMRMLNWLLQMSPNFSEKMGRLKVMSASASVADAYVNLFSGYLWESPSEVFVPGLVSPEWRALDQVRSLFPKAWSDISDPMKIFNYLDLKIYIGTHHNHTTDRFLMQRHIEGRFPYLDHEWLEYCYQLPLSYKIYDGQQKWMLRKIAQQYLDPQIMKMPKRGFGLSELIFTQDPASLSWIDKMLSSLKKRGVVMPTVIVQTLKESQQGLRQARRALYLAGLEQWMAKLEDY